MYFSMETFLICSYFLTRSPISTFFTHKTPLGGPGDQRTGQSLHAPCRGKYLWC